MSIGKLPPVASDKPLEVSSSMTGFTPELVDSLDSLRASLSDNGLKLAAATVADAITALAELTEALREARVTLVPPGPPVSPTHPIGLCIRRMDEALAKHGGANG